MVFIQNIKENKDGKMIDDETVKEITVIPTKKQKVLFN